MFSANDLHLKAQKLREHAQSAEALALYEQALVEYITDQDTEGIVRVLLEKDITYQHLYLFTKQYIYLELSATTLQMAEHMMHVNSEALDGELQALVVFHVAQLTEAMNESAEAIQIYEEALEYIPEESALRANMLSHLAVSEWNNQDTEKASAHFTEAHEMLEKLSADLDDTTRTIWLTGSLLRQAIAMKKSDPEKSLQYMKVAEELLESEEKFPIRWFQLQELREELAG
ncbi:hypothetical protein LRY65_00205 [Candidatus Woesebacteria bacterium]|nr:hypothetical protein [Candidatus Woesebacteria bacterium]MCD8507238.1 hypothetical protein [Candidatus Woesebacteria bacterium]MCD8526628.1 hypothetical protein [Candidatus Woesebacteria bacterium]MCD8546025.1 hypothetical protein [Candidatus Woesebacteria bacterium]